MNKYRQLELQRKTNQKKEEYKYFVGTTLKNPLEYEIGEKIVFKIRAKYMDDYLDIPYVWYKLLTDDNQDEEGYIKKSEDGWFYIEGSIGKSGFLYVQAKACDENKNIIEDIAVYNGSAGADVKNIVCSVEVPEDYYEFWKKINEEVEKTEPEILFKEKIEDENFPGFEIYDMRIKAPGDEYVSVILSYPEGAEKGSLKYAMFFQGYGVNTGIPRPLDGYLTVFVTAHCMPNRMGEAYYEKLRDGSFKGYGFDSEENKLPETTFWAKMFLRNLQALRFFKDHELINKKDYYFIGSSQGGMQACNMAAQFDKTTAVIMNVPWLSDIYSDEISGRRKNSMPKGKGIIYFDTSIAGKHLKCPAYIISGLGDCTCNSSTQMALYNAIESPKYIEFYQNKVHSMTIPWDNNKYVLGDVKYSNMYREFTKSYYDWN